MLQIETGAAIAGFAVERVAVPLVRDVAIPLGNFSVGALRKVRVSTAIVDDSGARSGFENGRGSLRARAGAARARQREKQKYPPITRARMSWLEATTHTHTHTHQVMHGRVPTTPWCECSNFMYP